MSEWLQLRHVTPLDGLVLAILMVAALRGLWIGLIREGCSLIALGGSFVAVRAFLAPASEWLVEATGGEIGPTAAPFLCGVGIGVATWLLVGLGARLLRRSAEVAGLGWADRAFGGALGATEGALVAGLVIGIATALVDGEDPLLADSRSVEVFEAARDYVQGRVDELPDVAAPGDPR